MGEGKNGSEKNFVATRKYSDANIGWEADDITVEDGAEYVIRMYVHNNSPKGRNAIAKDVRAFFNIPSTSAKTIKVTGFLNSSNATPTEYWDHVNFNSDTAFHLEPVAGSATIDNKDVGKNGGAKLSDDIWGGATGSTAGVLLGYDSLNGEIPGCFEFDSIVTIRVKAYLDRDYTVATKVRLANDTDKTWKKEVDAKEGDKVEFQIEYKNTDTVQHDRVVIGDILPDNLRYVPGSTIIYSGLHPNGVVAEKDDIMGTGLIIGNYKPGANAFVRITAEVVDDNFSCGKFILHNWGRASVGESIVQDSAAVNVQLAYCPDPEEPATPVDPEKPTEPTTPTNPTTPGTPSELPSTGPVAVAGSVIGIGSIVTAAGYYIASRRALR